MSVDVIQNIVVDTVSEMSTEVDELAGQRSIMVETVSGISTKVDDSQDDITVIVETVSGISTRVDTKNIFNFFIRLKL